MDQTNRIIEMPATKRETGVPRRQRLLHVLIEALFEIEIHDITARGHDIAHHPAPHIERVDENVASDRGNLVRLFALIEDQPQLVFTVRQLRAAHRF